MTELTPEESIELSRRRWEAAVARVDRWPGSSDMSVLQRAVLTFHIAAGLKLPPSACDSEDTPAEECLEARGRTVTEELRECFRAAGLDLIVSNGSTAINLTDPGTKVRAIARRKPDVGETLGEAADLLWTVHGIYADFGHPDWPYVEHLIDCHTTRFGEGSEIIDGKHRKSPHTKRPTWGLLADGIARTLKHFRVPR